MGGESPEGGQTEQDAGPGGGPEPVSTWGLSQRGEARARMNWSGQGSGGEAGGAAPRSTEEEREAPLLEAGSDRGAPGEEATRRGSSRGGRRAGSGEGRGTQRGQRIRWQESGDAPVWPAPSSQRNVKPEPQPPARGPDLAEPPFPHRHRKEGQGGLSRHVHGCD